MSSWTPAHICLHGVARPRFELWRTPHQKVLELTVSQLAIRCVRRINEVFAAFPWTKSTISVLHPMSNQQLTASVLPSLGALWGLHILAFFYGNIVYIVVKFHGSHVTFCTIIDTNVSGELINAVDVSDCNTNWLSVVFVRPVASRNQPTLCNFRGSTNLSLVLFIVA